MPVKQFAILGHPVIKLQLLRAEIGLCLLVAPVGGFKFVQE